MTDLDTFGAISRKLVCPDLSASFLSNRVTTNNDLNLVAQPCFFQRINRLFIESSARVSTPLIPTICGFTSLTFSTKTAGGTSYPDRAPQILQLHHALEDVFTDVVQISFHRTQNYCADFLGVALPSMGFKISIAAVKVPGKNQVADKILSFSNSHPLAIPAGRR